MSKVEVQRAQAKNMVESSRAYFNFLINSPLDSSIELWEESPVTVAVSLEEASQLAIQNRDELRQLEEYQQLNMHVTDLYRGNNIPGLFGVIDYGFQGEQYRFTSADDFMMASLVMKWNLFQGSTNRQKVKQSRIDGEKLKELYAETQQQIKLEVISHYYSVEAAYESVQSASKQTRSAIRAYDLINRKYLEGQSTLLELIDARTSLTNAAANSIIAQSDFYSSMADFEYAMAGTNLENYQ
jgi:outer membrane protein TolC